MVKISIIVPIFNADKFLKKCIDSILEQTIKDFELILVNDGSTDLSGYICDEYKKKDNRIVVVHKENGGVSETRNVGIEKATGKLVTFIDSDDFVENNYLEKMIKYDCDLVLGNINFINLKSTTSYQLSCEIEGLQEINELVIEELINSKYINSVYAKIYKKEIIDKYRIRFNRNICLGEDTMFVVDYLIKCKTLYIDNSLTYHYIDYGENSLSKFTFEKFLMLEQVNNYIKTQLHKKCLVFEESPAFNKRIWKFYEWAINEIINCKNTKVSVKIKSLNYIVKSNDYKKSLSNIDNYMRFSSSTFRKVLSTQNSKIIYIYILFSNYKQNIIKIIGFKGGKK